MLWKGGLFLLVLDTVGTLRIKYDMQIFKICYMTNKINNKRMCLVEITNQLTEKLYIDAKRPCSSDVTCWTLAGRRKATTRVSQIVSFTVRWHDTTKMVQHFTLKLHYQIFADLWPTQNWSIKSFWNIVLKLGANIPLIKPVRIGTSSPPAKGKPKQPVLSNLHPRFCGVYTAPNLSHHLVLGVSWEQYLIICAYKLQQNHVDIIFYCMVNVTNDSGRFHGECTDETWKPK